MTGDPDIMAARPARTIALSFGDVAAVVGVRGVSAAYATRDLACLDVALAFYDRHFAADAARRLYGEALHFGRHAPLHLGRPLATMPPCCCRLTEDEAALLSFLAAAQTGDASGLRREAASLALGEPSAPLLRAGIAFARALAAADAWLSQPDGTADTDARNSRRRLAEALKLH